MSGPESPRRAPPLSQQLQAVALVLVAVRGGIATRVAITKTSPQLRDGVQALIFQVLRNLGRAESLRNLLVQRMPSPGADALLCVVLALAWNKEDCPYDFFTLVNQAVDAAKRMPAARAQANFINACLRRFLREQKVLIEATDADLFARWNHPVWWIDQLRQERPDHWEKILEANNRHAPLTLRINTTKTSQNDYLQTLRRQGLDAVAIGQQVVNLRKARPVQLLPGFSEGFFSVQDSAAQLAAPLLLDGLQSSTKIRVLDACAAPGGKTAHLIEIGNVDVLALDVDAIRCDRIHQNLARLNLTGAVKVGDAGLPAEWWDGQPFDAILLDAPCTASGIVRRHPDVRWLRRAGDVQVLAQIQARLLRSLWPLVKKGGRLLYCTCSVFVAEGDGQIQTFLAHNTDARLLPSPGHLMPQFRANQDAVPDNSMYDHDGFFLALLEKI
jgi:16S rRNA (cytosine967-C5)-methyltransferase